LFAASTAYAWLGRWDEALDEAYDALKIAEEYSDNSLISFAALTFVFPYLVKGEVSRAIEYAELAVKKAPTFADKTWALGWLAWTQCHAGELERGTKGLLTMIQLLKAGGAVMTQFPAMRMLGEGYRLAGEFDEAKGVAQELLELAEGSGARPFVAMACLLLGQVALETAPDEALPHLERAIAIHEEIKAENYLALDYSGMGRYHKQQGNTEQAREYLTKALEIFERLGTLIEPDKVREELAGLPQ
jgi:tetratricopeptide (TPR) repeat protein